MYTDVGQMKMVMTGSNGSGGPNRSSGQRGSGQSKTNIVRDGRVQDFDCKSCTTFVLYLEPFLNTYYQAYQNVITVNVVPCGPFSDLVSKISVSALSPFQTAGRYASPFYRGGDCMNVVVRYPGAGIKDAEAFMGQDDIPLVLGYLLENGYTVDTSLTNMLNKSRIVMGGVSDRRGGGGGDRKMIAMIRYIGE